ncbi:hypothetical protein [Shewanella sp.]|uniref:hypothetical protein n=1 Tax=Shewanella sp. TaxID=50422 RepID=UPI003A8464C2
MKILKLTEAELVALNQFNSTAVIIGMYDLLDELIQSLEDESASEIYEELKQRLDEVNRHARSQFSIEQVEA